MARFLPTLAHASPNSAAEGKVLKWLSGLGDTWTVLHSVGITNHESKPWAEADVVLVGPDAVLVLEVKGGRVERRGGLWGFRDRHDRVTWKQEGPYAQVGGASAALRTHLVDAGVISRSTRVHWAVLLPDVVMPGTRGPDVLLEATLDASRVWGPASTEIDSVLDYWRGRFPGLSSLDDAVRSAVVERIRGDFSLIPLPHLTAAAVKSHQQRLTDEQRELIEAAEDNDRILVTGQAGTGKSALALMLARSTAASGQLTCFVVYNSALCRRAAEALQGTNVVVTTVDALALRTLNASSRRSIGAPDTDRGWRELSRDAAGVQPLRVYDALVIDEGQDLGRERLAVLDRALQGGLAGGQWRAFEDPGQQLFGDSPRSELAAFHSTRMRLTRNCRSTKQILATASLLCRVLLDINTPVHGPDVDIAWWSDEAEHDEALGRLLADRVADYGADNVLVAGRKTLPAQRIGGLSAVVGGAQLHDVRNSDTGPFIATTSAVKGLEADSVLVYGVDDLASERARRFLYTACTRASVHLTVLLSRAVEADFAAGGQWFGERLAALPK